jgi:hypothetical protein
MVDSHDSSSLIFLFGFLAFWVNPGGQLEDFPSLVNIGWIYVLFRGKQEKYKFIVLVF